MIRRTLAELTAAFVVPVAVTPNFWQGGKTANDDVVRARMFASKHGDKIRARHDGTWPVGTYPSQSEADLALMNDIAFASKDRVQAERMFRTTPSYRPATYANRQDLIDKLLDRAFDGKVFGSAASSEPYVFSPPTWPIEPISLQEFIFAKSAPKTIIKDLLYADAGTLIAAGATGKTTFAEWLAVHIVLGIDFAGRKIVSPGKVAIITGEDPRPILVARLRRIFTAMFPHGTMSRAEWQARLEAVLAGIIIIDVSTNVQRLTHIVGDVVRVDTAAVDALTTSLAPLGVSLLLIDPAVSFGVGEGRVNDAEQALIEAGRRIRSALECPVIYVHHTGKANAREKTKDQYSGRGGSAFADGSRMVFVMHKLTPAEWEKETGLTLEPRQVGLELTIAKLSYAGPQAPIYFIREGYKFRHVAPLEQSSVDGVFAFIAAEWAEDRKHSKSSVEKASKQLRMGRDKIRSVVDRLIEHGRLKPEKGEGNSQWLEPVSVADAARETGGDDA